MKPGEAEQQSCRAWGKLFKMRRRQNEAAIEKRWNHIKQIIPTQPCCFWAPTAEWKMNRAIMLSSDINNGKTEIRNKKSEIWEDKFEIISNYGVTQHASIHQQRKLKPNEVDFGCFLGGNQWLKDGESNLVVNGHATPVPVHTFTERGWNSNQLINNYNEMWWEFTIPYSRIFDVHR